MCVHENCPCTEENAYPLSGACRLTDYHHLCGLLLIRSIAIQSGCLWIFILLCVLHFLCCFSLLLPNISSLIPPFHRLPPSLLPRCVFLPDNGAFFVNYVITAALLGTGMELMRLGSLCTYCTRLFFSRSEPERVHIRKVRASSSLTSILSFSWEGKEGVLLGALGPTMKGL